MSIEGRVSVGTCGFRVPRAEYARLLSCVEVQHTFYQPPQTRTLARWREEAPPGFEFTLKAWQLITHDAKSPTYKRLKKKLSSAEREEAGYFRPTSVVRDAWEVTRACAAALAARTVVFQCPASFRQTAENVSNLERFLSGIDRGGLNLCWEPRGDWDGEVVRGICEGLDLWHVVDPFSERTMTPGRCYFRLHGRRGWRYKYEEGELEELAAMLPEGGSSYVFFNNIHMTEDALKFKEVLNERRLEDRGAEGS